MTIRFTVLSILLLLITLTDTSCRSRSKSATLSRQIIARSLVSTGNLSRLDRVMLKALRGEPITLGFIGGSITRGERATSADRQYADRVARWWVDRFPMSKITLVNAGVSGTNSGYGCLRAGRDLLPARPDFVVVEFGVNDRDELARAETYEGVVRQVLAATEQPAVVLLFAMHHDGTNAQAMQSEVGRRYGLPMISYRDALWPEIVAGRMELSDCFADTVHPNDQGHAAIATFINSFLQETLDHLPDEVVVPSGPLPAPRFTDLFEHTKLIPASDLKPVSCSGWAYENTTQSWRSDRPGSVIEFEVSGEAIDLLYEKMDGGFGTVWVTVDDGDPMLCDSWLNGSWGPLCQTDRIARGAGLHRLRVELLNQKNSMSSGNEFHILGLGTAGR